MEQIVKWYERERLSFRELEWLVSDGDYRPMNKISPFSNPRQTENISVGAKLAVLLNNGILGHYTVTSLSDQDGLYAVGRDETGVSDEKGKEFCIDSGMGWCQSVGYKILEKFPFEM